MRQTTDLPDVLSVADEARLLDEAGPSNYLWLVLGLDAGLRVAEICSVGPDDVHRAESLLSVRGKGGRLRRVPIGSRLGHALSVEDLTRQAFRVPPSRCYIPRTPRTLQRRFKSACRSAGILMPGRTPHSLRHTYATRLVAARVPLPMVQLCLGHRSLATTQVYLHCLPGWELEVTRALDSYRIEPSEEAFRVSHFHRNATPASGPLSHRRPNRHLRRSRRESQTKLW